MHGGGRRIGQGAARTGAAQGVRGVDGVEVQRSLPTEVGGVGRRAEAHGHGRATASNRGSQRVIERLAAEDGVPSRPTGFHFDCESSAKEIVEEFASSRRNPPKSRKYDGKKALALVDAASAVVGIFGSFTVEEQAWGVNRSEATVGG